jgi:hypothetical protein
MENKKLPAVDNVSSKGVHFIDMSEMDDANHIGKQQPPAAPVNPDDEDNYLKKEISALVATYDKYTDEIYKLLSLGATMHEPALMAVFTGQHYKGAIILSAIVSGVIVALLRIYRKQFRLLRRLRPLLQNRNSSRGNWIEEHGSLMHIRDECTYCRRSRQSGLLVACRKSYNCCDLGCLLDLPLALLKVSSLVSPSFVSHLS